MNRAIILLLTVAAPAAKSVLAQQLLSAGQTFTYDFNGLLYFGDGYAGANARGFAHAHR